MEIVSNKLKPNVFIVGAAKSGTTTLAKLLAEHPLMFLGNKKEPEFFSFENNYEKGEDWYLDNFAGSKQGQKIIDASTGYSRYPECPNVAQRIHEFNPYAKIIFLLRHPVDRAYSHYIHRYSKEVYPNKPFEGTFSTFTEKEPMVINSSDYRLQIQQYLKYFNEANILVLFTEDMKNDLSSILTKVTNFLSIVPFNEFPKQEMQNVTSDYLESRVRVRFMHSLNQYPFFRFLKVLFPKNFKYFVFSKVSSSKRFQSVRDLYVPPKLSQEERQKLLRTFESSNQWVETFSNTNHPDWYS